MTTLKDLLVELTAIRLGIESLLSNQLGVQVGLLDRAKMAVGTVKTRPATQVEREFAERIKKGRGDAVVDGRDMRVVEFDPVAAWKQEQLAEIGDDTVMMEFVQVAGVQAYEAYRNGNMLAIELFERFKLGSDIRGDGGYREGNGFPATQEVQAPTPQAPSKVTGEASKSAERIQTRV